MDPSDIFRRFFGFTGPEHHNPQRRQEEFFIQEEEPAFFHSFDWASWREVDELFDRCFKDFQDMQKVFPAMPDFRKDSDFFGPHFGGSQEARMEKVAPNPRQKMLKEPDPAQPSVEFPAQRSPSKDQDLDGEVRERGLDAILPSPPKPLRPDLWFFRGTRFSPDHQQHGQFQYESSEVQIEDGRITKVKESHFFRVDEEGKEVQTIIREKDNVRQVITTTRDKQGREQTTEYKQPLPDSPDSHAWQPMTPIMLTPSAPDQASPRPQPSLFLKLFSLFRAEE